MSSARPTVLAIHDDTDALDALTRLFEAAGCDVLTAVSGFRAQAQLEGDRPIDVVVAPWDTHHAVGGEVYRWALQHRYDLRDQFVFLALDSAPEFDQIVDGRCLAVPPTRPNEVVRVAMAAVQRRTRLEAAREVLGELDASKPRLLLVEDDPVLLAVIGELLTHSGFTVTSVESGYAAIALLQDQAFDVLVVDWQADGGAGADLYRWLLSDRPALAERVVFLSSTDASAAAQIAPGRPWFRKGQDAHGLIAVLHEIARTRYG